MTEKPTKPASEKESFEIDTSWQYTRCPECKAVFRVDQSKLYVRQGEVRCGSCRVVFHAPAHKVFRNHGGGFSTLIPESADKATEQTEPSKETESAVQNAGSNDEPDVSDQSPISTTVATPADTSAESTSLFPDEFVSGDSDSAPVEGSSRLFRESLEVIESDTVDLSTTESQKSIEHEIIIPKISSEPLVSRLQDEAEEYRREPIISTADTETLSGSENIEEQITSSDSDSLQAQSESVRAAREALIFQPLSEIESKEESMLNQERSPASFSSTNETDGKWNDATVTPYGATAMQLPPQFEPFVPDQVYVPEPINTDEDSKKQAYELEDSLLDHNPFTPKIDEVTKPPATEIKIEPRPAAINMSGVDEYIVDRPNPLAGFFWFLVSASFVVLLGLQVKYFLVERFAQDESYRPYLQVFCGIARCELPPRRDAYRFTITQTRVDLHPQEPGALRITVRLLNQAKFAQPYPDLRLTLTDRVGRVVGRRKFEPGFYLPKGAATRLSSGELGYVVFDLAQPHEKAVGFVVDVVRRTS